VTVTTEFKLKILLVIALHKPRLYFEETDLQASLKDMDARRQTDKTGQDG
jgi:hypothetical protein